MYQTLGPVLKVVTQVGTTSNVAPTVVPLMVCPQAIGNAPEQTSFEVARLNVTVLSVLVEVALPITLTVPVAALAGTFAITVPLLVIPETATLYVVGPPVTTFVVAPAVPDKFTPAAVKPVTGSLNTTVKLIGDAEVGSGCAAA